MPRLILDVMGGDDAPDANLEGVLQALPELATARTELILVGDENVIREKLEKKRYRALRQVIEATSADVPAGSRSSGSGARVRIIHAPDSIEMGDSIRAVRNKPNASINVGCKLAAEDWKRHKANPAHEASAFISAGHSGAMMASALVHMGRLHGAERPAIAVKLPTLSPNGCVMLDVGANVDCKPEHLRDFALMGAVFAQVERVTDDLPKVGVLSNGEERSKGNELTRSALALIEQVPGFSDPGERVGQFVGYAEGKELFLGKVDVVVTDGFVGNLVLKSVEGLGSAVVRLLKREARSSPLTLFGFLLSSKAFRQLKKRLDYAEYGAAPLLGVAGYAFICHGRSNAKAIKNALLRTQAALGTGYVQKLERALSAVTRAAS